MHVCHHPVAAGVLHMHRASECVPCLWFCTHYSGLLSKSCGRLWNLGLASEPAKRACQSMPKHAEAIVPPCLPPPPPSPSPSCRSVVETIKIVTETLEALFDMRLPVPGGVVRALATGLDEAMQR